jgi:hypothetical protein
MDREQLMALGDAIGVVLTWPDGVRAEIARWIMPEASKPNGRDFHPLCPRCRRAPSKRAAAGLPVP